MIEAKDVLLIVLAFCALWFTAFVCWLIYQIAMILKNVNDTIKDVKSTLGKIETALSGIRGRFDHATSSIVLVLEGARKIVEFISETKKKKAKK